MEKRNLTQTPSSETMALELKKAHELIAKQEELIRELSQSKEEDLKSICHQLASPVQVISMTVESYLMRKTNPTQDSLLRLQNAAHNLVKVIEDIRSKRITRLKSLESDIVV